MDFEVELKFPVESFEGVTARVSELGGAFGDECCQADRYFNHPARDFGETDEALRIRAEEDGSCLTYKGPVEDAEVKLRREIEVPLASGSEHSLALAAALTALGFREVREVVKWRRSCQVRWQGREFTVTQDRVDGLGCFVEVETLADGSEKAEAREAVLQLAGELGLAQAERRSYLELVLAQDDPAGLA